MIAERKCLNCNKTFVPKIGVQAYCNSHCRNQAKFKRIYNNTPGYYPKKPNKKVFLPRGRKLTDKREISQREYKKLWWIKNKERIAISKKIYTDALRFGGNRDLVLERDKWECQMCGMNNEQHIVIFGKGLNIHHIDNNRNNNVLDNLISLCLKCHFKKHSGDINK